LTAIALVAIVVAAGFGYWLLAPRMPSGLVTYTTQETSLLTSSEQTHLTSTLSADLTSETTQWINVNTAQPVSYYLTLLESNGAQPYVQLAKELRKLPDLKNATAVAKITYLALNATNPEVKEAFELMIKGGTPDPRDFTYSVPTYNTELQILYRLACQNDFKRDDTLALAVAMVNGLWVTMGDQEVRNAVYRDASDLLSFFRETNEWQRCSGAVQLERFPLEAKICLAWRGNYAAMSGRPQHLPSFKKSKLPKWTYDWLTVNKASLLRMREEVIRRGWYSVDANSLIANLEYFFYFDKGGKAGASTHWVYEGGDEVITVENRTTVNHDMSNADFVFQFFLENEYAFGDCGDETTLVDALAKSVGVATDPVSYGVWYENSMIRHVWTMYYDPISGSWKSYGRQASIDAYPSSLDDKTDLKALFFVNKPPVSEQGYIRNTDYAELSGYSGRTVFRTDEYTIQELCSLLSRGVEDSTVKEWLLYS